MHWKREARKKQRIRSPLCEVGYQLSGKLGKSHNAAGETAGWDFVDFAGRATHLDRQALERADWLPPAECTSNASAGRDCSYAALPADCNVDLLQGEAAAKFLHVAAMLDHLDAAQALLAAGADAEATNHAGRTVREEARGKGRVSQALS